MGLVVPASAATAWHGENHGGPIPGAVCYFPMDTNHLRLPSHGRRPPEALPCKREQIIDLTFLSQQPAQSTMNMQVSRPSETSQLLREQLCQASWASTPVLITKQAHDDEISAGHGSSEADLHGAQRRTGPS